MFLLLFCFSIFTHYCGCLTENFIWPQKLVWPNAPPSNASQFVGYVEFSGDLYQYILVESENDTYNDPLIILWNSARGCSSLYFFFTIAGPLKIDKSGSTLFENPYSWSKFSNLLILDVPAGSGYSAYESFPTIGSDEESTLVVEIILSHFFSRFKYFEKNDIYLAGDGQASFSIPVLAELLAESIFLPNNNLKGIILANPKLDHNVYQFDKFSYLYNRGMIDERTKEFIRTKCCGGSLSYCFNHTADIENVIECKIFFKYELDKFWRKELNPYNIYDKCEDDMLPDGFDATCRLKCKSGQKKISQFIDIFDEFKENKRKEDSLRCVNEAPIEIYLNTCKVRKALFLHETSGFNRCWRTCNDVYFFSNIQKLDDWIRRLKTFNLSIYLYGGDLSYEYNFLSVEKRISSLAYERVNERAPFYVDSRIAGYSVTYGNITVTTILGAGHAGKGREKETSYALQEFIRRN